ncbi:polyketide synthase dehydratase domain-containing protein, partial [Nonomuraea muscovyensis]|uniref:SpnB-like Rossmann fold domain-containing protein n=1 Tax=Nonomuraea muscovyensis TaxID=1124761 RepID=UPI003409EE61
EVTLPDTVRDGPGYGLHPALFDAALHGIDLAHPAGDTVDLPFTWTGVTLHATGATRARARITTTDGVTSVVLADGAGAPLAEVNGLTMRPVADAPAAAPAAAPRDGLYQVAWTAGPQPAQVAGQVAMIGNGDDDAWLRRALATAGVAVADDVGGRGAVLVAAPATPSRARSGDDADTGAPSSVHAVLAMLQAWLADERSATTRLAVVTRGAVSAGADDAAPEPEQAAVAGLLRAAQAENPGRLLLIDVDGADASYRALPAVLEADEPEVALRAGAALTPRLARAEPAPLRAPGGAWRVDVTEKGTIDNLTTVPLPDRPPAPGEVRVAMRACGLNFRDVLIALGMYPGAAELGSEGAGVVVEVGDEVTDLAPGDRVMGLFDAALATHAVADRRHLVPIPDGWDFATAAAVPAVFATAYYGLVDLAGLRAGEKVLIHAAAGGVGMAAVQIARHLGAEVFGTASP